MKRSEINQIIDANIAFIESMNFTLPPFAFFTPEEWREKSGEYQEIKDNLLGWDITDFGSGDYLHTGLFLFTIRNGNQKHPELYKKPYAEKIMVVGDHQVTPFHFHWHKMEDIINRGGAPLIVQIYNADREEKFADTPVEIHSDGRIYTVPAGTKITLEPGESITMQQYQYHSFWADGGKALVGEVSQCNDDAADNRFVQEIGRFPQIEEDEPARYLLCTEYPKFK